MNQYQNGDSSLCRWMMSVLVEGWKPRYPWQRAGSRFFGDFLLESGLKFDWVTCTDVELCEALCKAYVAIRTKTGACYQRSSDQGFEAADNRKLIKHDKWMNIFMDPGFVRANQVHYGMLKKLTSKGENNATKNKPVTFGDDFKNHQPLPLQQRSWRSQHESVFFLQLLLQPLHPSCNRLFQCPRKNYCACDVVWYENAPLGKKMWTIWWSPSPKKPRWVKCIPTIVQHTWPCCKIMPFRPIRSWQRQGTAMPSH